MAHLIWHTIAYPLRRQQQSFYSKTIFRTINTDAPRWLSARNANEFCHSWVLFVMDYRPYRFLEKRIEQNCVDDDVCDDALLKPLVTWFESRRCRNTLEYNTCKTATHSHSTSSEQTPNKATYILLNTQHNTHDMTINAMNAFCQKQKHIERIFAIWSWFCQLSSAHQLENNFIFTHPRRINTHLLSREFWHKGRHSHDNIPRPISRIAL